MAKLEQYHLEYLKDKIFLQKYLEILNNRLIYSNNKLELNNKEQNKLYDYAHKETLNDNYEAMNILLKRLTIEPEKPLTEDLIRQVANTINKHALYISNDYRKIGDGLKFKDTYPISSPKNIEKEMKELLNKYNNEWNKLDIFEREALFNIEFLRIHPFEDGNGRTSRLILNYNILRQGHAPILIPESKREEYFDARNKEDVLWIKKLFEQESQNELILLNKLIEENEIDKDRNNYKSRR